MAREEKEFLKDRIVSLFPLTFIYTLAYTTCDHVFISSDVFARYITAELEKYLALEAKKRSGLLQR